MRIDAEVFGTIVGATVTTHVGRALAPLTEKVAALEAKPEPVMPDPDDAVEKFVTALTAKLLA